MLNLRVWTPECAAPQAELLGMKVGEALGDPAHRVTLEAFVPEGTQDILGAIVDAIKRYQQEKRGAKRPEAPVTYLRLFQDDNARYRRIVDLCVVDRRGERVENGFALGIGEDGTVLRYGGFGPREGFDCDGEGRIRLVPDGSL